MKTAPRQKTLPVCEVNAVRYSVALLCPALDSVLYNLNEKYPSQTSQRFMVSWWSLGQMSEVVVNLTARVAVQGQPCDSQRAEESAD